MPTVFRALAYPNYMTSTAKGKVTVMMLIVPFHPAPMGGAELQATNVARRLKSNGNDVFIVTIAMKGQAAEDNFEGIKVFRVKQLFDLSAVKRPSAKKKVKIEYEKNRTENFAVQTKKSVFALLNYFFFFINVLRLLRSKNLNVDIIYTPIVEWVGYIATLLALRLKKTVFIKDSTMNGVSSLLRYPMGSRMHATIVKEANFIAMTHAIQRNFLAAGIARSRTFQIPNGVALSEKPDRTNVNRNTFIFVGNLYQQPAKGVDILLKAWKMVTWKYPQMQLQIVGDGATQEYHDYVKEIGIENNVSFLGKRKDIPQLFSHAYAFVLPSRREGMSNALLEAMSSGLPCIATDISGNQDLIVHGRNGLLVPVEDEESLAKAIIEMYEDQAFATQAGIEARRTIENGYTQDQVAARYEDAFFAAIAGVE